MNMTYPSSSSITADPTFFSFVQTDVWLIHPRRTCRFIGKWTEIECFTQHLNGFVDEAIVGK